jgi:hypothetical protein
MAIRTGVREVFMFVRCRRASVAVESPALESLCVWLGVWLGCARDLLATE